MEQVPFIFSEERRYKIARHLSYWAFWWIFQGLLYSFTPVSVGYDLSLRLLSSFTDSLFYLCMHILLSYSLIYFLIPRYLLKQRYQLAALLAILFFLVVAFLNAVLAKLIIAPLHIKWGLVTRDKAFLEINYLTILAGLRGGLTIAGLSCAIKLMKLWSIKERRNLQLQKENLESRLELLKSQVHPHFLFNTLNNLYSLTLTQSKEAPLVVTHLSELLRYMLYECNGKTVPLEKEVEALKKHVELEKLRYGSRIDVSFVCTGAIEKVEVAPLLFLPFVENSFKHGVSHVIDQCWINLSLHASHNTISFNLSNSVVPGKLVTGVGGIGIQNVRNRLALLYPQQHELLLSQTEDIFNIRVTINLSNASLQPEPGAIQSTVSLNPQLAL